MWSVIICTYHQVYLPDKTEDEAGGRCMTQRADVSYKISFVK